MKMDFIYKWIEHIPSDHSVGDAQIRELFKWASTIDGNAVEIGSFYGRSTVVIGYGLKIGQKGKVFAIDPHQNRYNSFIKCSEYISKTTCKEHIQIVRDLSENVLKTKSPKEIFESPVNLLFIDGDHSYEGIKKDLNWIDVVPRGGVIILHDYSSKYPGIIQAINEFRLQNPMVFEQIKLLGSMVIFRKS